MNQYEALYKKLANLRTENEMLRAKINKVGHLAESAVNHFDRARMALVCSLIQKLCYDTLEAHDDTI